MLRMQADMPCHYFQGYGSSRDLNLNASCNVWPLNKIDTVPKKGNYYNGSLGALYPDQFLAYKEKMKQTMLQHEAIFKDQIHELHRVYNRQRELMDEMKRINFYGRHLMQVPQLQSNRILHGTSSEYSQKTCKVSAIPCLNRACGPSPVFFAENNQTGSNYLAGNFIQAGFGTFQAKGRGEKSELPESKFKKIGKKILDLELPAYEYIDSEKEDSTAPEALTLDTKSNCSAAQNSDQQRSHVLEDGNAASRSHTTAQASFSARTTCLADLNEPIKLEEETDPKFNDFLHPVSDNLEIRYPDLCGERNSNLQALPKEIIDSTQMREDTDAASNVLHLENTQSGQEEAGTQSCVLNSFSERTSTETLITLSEDHNKQAWKSSTSHLKRKREVFGLESGCGQVATACTNTSKELVPLDDVINRSSSPARRRKNARDIIRVPIVQALPRLKNAAHLSRSSNLRSSRITIDKSSCARSVESRAKPKSPSTQSSFCSGKYGLLSADIDTEKPIEDSVDFNLTKAIDPNSASCDCSSEVAARVTCFTDCEKKKCKESIVGSTLLKANSAYPLEHLTADERFIGSKFDQKSTSSGIQVDLNSCINEAKSSSLLPSLSSEVDLKAPASPENKERSPPRGESDEIQLETPSILSEKEDRDLLEDLASVAAGALVFMASSEAQNNIENATTKPSEAVESASLYWFAKLACSVADDPHSEFGLVSSCKNPGCPDEYLLDQVDYFEAMTLKLEETKEEEYCYNANVQMEEMRCPASSSSQPKRGRTRRVRQQQKDFQSEILPSLAALSRYEVTEDLQVIGGLIEAAHRITGIGTGRNAWTTGRRRRSSTSFFKAETSECTLLKLQNRHGKCRIEEWSLIGWGRRRSRGPRYPASNPRLISSQV